MRNPAVAAFLNQLADDESLRQALVGFAALHGFRFTVRDLSEVDFRSLAAGAPAEAPDDRDEETTPGYGIEEFPA